MDDLFSVHMLNEDGKRKARDIAEGFKVLLFNLKEHCAESRSFSRAKSALEDACFHAKKAMAQRPENQAEYIPPGGAT